MNSLQTFSLVFNQLFLPCWLFSNPIRLWFFFIVSFGSYWKTMTWNFCSLFSCSNLLVSGLGSNVCDPHELICFWCKRRGNMSPASACGSPVSQHYLWKTLLFQTVLAAVFQRSWFWRHGFIYRVSILIGMSIFLSVLFCLSYSSLEVYLKI